MDESPSNFIAIQLLSTLHPFFGRADNHAKT